MTTLEVTLGASALLPYPVRVHSLPGWANQSDRNEIMVHPGDHADVTVYDDVVRLGSVVAWVLGDVGAKAIVQMEDGRFVERTPYQLEAVAS